MRGARIGSAVAATFDSVRISPHTSPTKTHRSVIYGVYREQFVIRLLGLFSGYLPRTARLIVRTEMKNHSAACDETNESRKPKDGDFCQEIRNKCDEGKRRKNKEGNGVTLAIWMGSNWVFHLVYLHTHSITRIFRRFKVYLSHKPYTLRGNDAFLQKNRLAEERQSGFGLGSASARYTLISPTCLH